MNPAEIFSLVLLAVIGGNGMMVMAVWGVWAIRRNFRDPWGWFALALPAGMALLTVAAVQRSL